MIAVPVQLFMQVCFPTYKSATNVFDPCRYKPNQTVCAEGVVATHIGVLGAQGTLGVGPRWSNEALHCTTLSGWRRHPEYRR